MLKKYQAQTPLPIPWENHPLNHIFLSYFVDGSFIFLNKKEDILKTLLFKNCFIFLASLFLK